MADLLWARCRGRNGWDSPLDLPDDMAAEVRNMHFYEGALGTKRGGSTSVSLSGMSGINYLSRFVPGQDESAAEMFMVDDSATNKILRMAAGSSFSNLTLKDNLTAASDKTISTATINGKHYLAYDSAVNRLHVFDPGLSTTEVRRAGVGTPAAPTAADTGSGTYPATVRYYRVAFTEQRSSVTVRRSLLSSALTFTPSGSGTHARVTKPASLSEGETHWELYASSDNVTFYGPVATTAVGTTTYDDNTTVANYADLDAAPEEGANTPFPSVKYLATDGNRLLGYGAWETSAGDSLTPRAGRVWFTPVLDTSSVHDDERVSNTTAIKGWIDISRNAGSADRGITPEPLFGQFYVFQSRGVTQLSPTESAAVPYRRIKVSSKLGAVSHQSIVMAEDESGRPCAYFLDPELGPYRIGAGGFQRCGKDVQDIWDTVNLAATNVVAWGIYYKPLNLVIFAIATGSNNDPDTMIAFDVTEGRLMDSDGVRGGWSVWDGDFAEARCGVMFASTLGATMGLKLVPYVGASSGTVLLRYNPAVNTDNTAAFRAYLRSKAFDVDQVTHNKSVMRSHVLATAETSVTLTQGLVRNFGDETTRTDTVSLTAAGSETRVLRRLEAPELEDAFVFQVEIGDASAADTAFTLERWAAEYKVKESR